MTLLDSDTVNGIAGIAALVNQMILVPSVLALRKIAGSHEGRLSQLEAAKPKAKARRARGR